MMTNQTNGQAGDQTPTPPTFEIVVSNIGSVGKCNNLVQANALYWQYVRISKAGNGRASGEDVTMFRNDEIHREYIGTLSQGRLSRGFDA